MLPPLTLTPPPTKIESDSPPTAGAKENFSLLASIKNIWHRFTAFINEYPEEIGIACILTSVTVLLAGAFFSTTIFLVAIIASLILFGVGGKALEQSKYIFSGKS